MSNVFRRREGASFLASAYSEGTLSLRSARVHSALKGSETAESRQSTRLACRPCRPWAVKYDFQLIYQSEDAKMRSRPKDGIEHRQYLRLKKRGGERQGFPRH